MLTRIEIDGFKSFDRFALDLPPFLVVLGQNASGKSNLFDAIQLLRRLASDKTLQDAFEGARGDLTELFRRRGDGTSVTRMRFAVEVLLEPMVVDPFGQESPVGQTRLRYEVEIESRVLKADGFIRPFVVHESVVPIQEHSDAWTTRQDLSDEFRLHKLRYGRQAPLLTTVTDGKGRRSFKIVEGHGQELPGFGAGATVLSSVTSVAEFPLLFALRRELESWRFLQLDPAALRLPASGKRPGDQLESSGANLPGVLRRIEQSTRDPFGSGLDEIATDLARVVRGFAGVEVTEDKPSGSWEVHLTTRDEGRVNARVASDGTLRVLAMLAALYDPQYRGMLCFEEPENGIFPQRLRSLVLLLKELVTDPGSQNPGVVGEPMSQVILTSHSPLMLAVLEPRDVVVMDWVSRVEQGERASRLSRVRALRGSGESDLDLLSQPEQRELLAISKDEASRLLEA
ncbi:AAA family ATPase [Amycolatopsis sp. H20-H5]|uniref:AAA family ATPase n=1 Tax=Amycolatopsis sp. H20-H5 TaxID=3046309 RepID=UPI002DB727FF|nr:AAA family ATPase [Amycolatopsis sp. H20-H5]MEC3973807.1 AAA family ATPase [Amycolatopsis sp. H20-H5]